MSTKLIQPDYKGKGMLSEHITYGEVICKDCAKVHKRFHPLLFLHFEEIRAAFGNRPIQITSGSRCKKRQEFLLKHNRTRSVAAQMSPHTPWLCDTVEINEEGEIVQADGVSEYHLAIDFYLPPDWTPNAAVKAVRSRCGRNIRIGWRKYLEYKPHFFHIDVAHLVKTYEIRVPQESQSLTTSTRHSLKEKGKYIEDENAYLVDGYMLKDVEFEKNIIKPSVWTGGYEF